MFVKFLKNRTRLYDIETVKEKDGGGVTSASKWRVGVLWPSNHPPVPNPYFCP